MSNYLITLKLNYLQSEIDLLKAVDGLTNPLTGDIDGDGHSITNINDILSDGMLETGSIRATTDIQSLTGTISGPIISGNTIEGGDITATGTVSGTIVSGGTVHGGNITASNTITSTGTVTGNNLIAVTTVSSKNILFQNTTGLESTTISQDATPNLYITATNAQGVRGYLTDTYYNTSTSSGYVYNVNFEAVYPVPDQLAKLYTLSNAYFSFPVGGYSTSFITAATILRIPLTTGLPVANPVQTFNSITFSFQSLTMPLTQYNGADCNAIFYISAFPNLNTGGLQDTPTVLSGSYFAITSYPSTNNITFGPSQWTTTYSDTQNLEALATKSLWITMAIDSGAANPPLRLDISNFTLTGAEYTLNQNRVRPLVSAILPN